MLNLKMRRFIAIFFIMAFIIATPILILYTAGYRYNIKKQQVSKTGSLVIETKPKDATVSLSTIDETFQTPLRLTNLFPNNYTITVERDGYYSWKKRLSVESQLTTFAEDIILFKQSASEQLLDLTITDMVVSGDKEKAVLRSRDKEGNLALSYYTFKNQKRVKIPYKLPEKGTLTNISWSPDNRFILLTQTIATTPETTTYLAYDVSDKPSKILHPFFSTATNLRWSIEHNDTLLGYRNNTIVALRIKPEWKNALQPIESKEIATFKNKEHITDFITYNDTLYYIAKIDDAILLQKKRLTEEKPGTLHPQIKLNNTNNYIIETIIDNKLVLREVTRNTIYLVNLNLDNVLLQRNDIITYDHFKKDNRLLLSTDSEIVITDLKNYPLTFETVTRVSGGISNATWYPVPNYVFYIQNNKMTLIELDQRDIKNVVTLPIEGVNTATLDQKGKKIYYTLIEKPGLYSVEITD